MSTALSPMESTVLGFEQQFNEVNAYKLNFKKEANFALQLLKGNDYLRSTAQKNPDSLLNAITNLAAIGISLNPATKESYLVPRGSAVCLDISAIGLIKLATDSGSILWGQAKLVYAKDTYENQGVSREPIHKYQAFGDRGALIGGYVIAKTQGGDFLVEEMSLKDCHDIRDRSEAWKAYVAGKTKSCPWATDEGEMVKKTIIKRAQKYWPKSERVDEAVKILNMHEGIDFNAQKSPYMPSGTLEVPTESTFTNLRTLLAAKNKADGKERTERDLLDRIATQANCPPIERLEDMNSAQIEVAYRVLGGAK
jgi:recombination protein RecT